MDLINRSEQASVKERIVGRLKKAAINITVHDCEAFMPNRPDAHRPPLANFAENLKKLNGTVIICENISDVADKLTNLIEERGWKKVGCPDKKIQDLIGRSNNHFVFENTPDFDTKVIITGCEALAAETGSIMVSTALTGSRKAFVLSPVHVVISMGKQVHNSLDEAFEAASQVCENKLPSMISVITGPSRTADIEKTLILGAHGPKELFVFIAKQDF